MNYLNVLQLSPTATIKDIKAAYRKLAVVHHPDLGGSAAKFIELQSAYEYAIKHHIPQQIKSTYTSPPKSNSYNVYQREAQFVRDLSRDSWSTPTHPLRIRMPQHTLQMDTRVFVVYNRGSIDPPLTWKSSYSFLLPKGTKLPVRLIQPQKKYAIDVLYDPFFNINNVHEHAQRTIINTKV